MKNLSYLLLSFLLVLSGTPINALAANMVTTPPVFVRTSGLNDDIKQIKNDMLNQERSNRDEEYLTKELSQENVALIHKLQEMQAQVGLSNPDLKTSDLFTSIDTMNQLKDIMLVYSQQLDERNRRRIVQNEELSALRARIDKLEHLYGDVTTLDNTVESVKYLPTINSPEETALLAKLETQKEFLVFKSKTLVEQYQQLIDYKSQLMRTQSELRTINQRYQKVVELTATPKTAPADTSILKESSESLSKSIKVLNMEVDRLAEYQKSLKEKDEHIAKLANMILKKDEEIANLKASLAEVQEKLAEAQGTISKKDEEVSHLKVDLSSSQDQLAKSQAAMDNLHQTISEIKGSMDTLKESNATTQEGYEGIRKQILILKDKLVEAQKRAALVDDQDKELVKIKADNAALSAQVKSDREELSKYQDQVKQLTQTLEQLNEKLNLKDKEIDQLKEKTQEVQGYKEAVERLRIQIALMKGQVTEARQDLGDYQERVKEVNKATVDEFKVKISSKDIEINDLKQKVEQGAQYKDIIKQLQVQISSLTDEVSSFKGQINMLLVNKERSELLEELIAKHQAIEQLFVQKCSLLTQLALNNQSKAEYYKAELIKTIAYWQKISEKDLEQISGLKKQAEDKQQQVRDLQNNLISSKKQVAEFGSMLDVYQKKADNKDVDFQNKLKEIDQLQGDLQTAQETLSQRDKELKKVQAFFFELEKNSSEKSKELKDKTEQVGKLKSSLDEKTTDYEQLQTKFALIQSQLQSSKNIINVQAEDLKQVEQKMQVSNPELKEKDDQVAILRMTLEQKKTAIAHLEEQLKTSGDIIKAQADNLKQAQETPVINSKELKDKNEQVALLDASLDQKKEELAQAQAKLAVLEEKLSNTQNLLKLQAENLKKSQDAYKNQASQNIKVRGLLEDQKEKLAGASEKLAVTEAKLKVSVDQEELKKTQEMLKATNLEVMALQTALKSKETENKMLKQHTTNDSALQNGLEEAKAKIKKMMEDLFYKDKQIQRLKMQLSDKDKTIKPVAQKLDESLKGQSKDKVLKDKIYKEEQIIKSYKEELAKLQGELKRKQNTLEFEEGLPVVVELVQGHWSSTKTTQEKAMVPVQIQQQAPVVNIETQSKQKPQDVAGYKAQIENLQKELKEKEEIIAHTEAGDGSAKSLRQKLKVALADFEEARVAAKNKSDQAKVLSEQVAELNTKINLLQKKIDSFQGKDNN